MKLYVTVETMNTQNYAFDESFKKQMINDFYCFFNIIVASLKVFIMQPTRRLLKFGIQVINVWKRKRIRKRLGL